MHSSQNLPKRHRTKDGNSAGEAECIRYPALIIGVRIGPAYQFVHERRRLPCLPASYWRSREFERRGTDHRNLFVRPVFALARWWQTERMVSNRASE
jgi:hypothetical protein